MDHTGAFTYDSSLPTARDRMRSTVGDTDATQPLRYDETYDELLSYYGDESVATAKLARSLASQFARQPVSVSIPGGPSVSYSDRVKTLLDTAKQIETAVGPGAGGTSYLGFTVSRPGMNAEDTSEYRRGYDNVPEGVT